MREIEYKRELRERKIEKWRESIREYKIERVYESIKERERV